MSNTIIQLAHVIIVNCNGQWKTNSPPNAKLNYVSSSYSQPVLCPWRNIKKQSTPVHYTLHKYTKMAVSFTSPLCSIFFCNKTDRKESFLCQSHLTVSVSHGQNLFLSLTATQDSREQNPIQYIHWFYNSTPPIIKTRLAFVSC